MKRYPKLRYPGDKETQGLFAAGTIVIQEKLDGANFRFTWDPDGGLTFGSRRTEGEGLDKNQFADAIEYVDENVDHDALEDQYFRFGKLVYFGEFMDPHTISYDWANTPEFIGFDVWSVDDEEFLEHDIAMKCIRDLDLPTVPHIDTIEADEWEDYDFEVPESEYYDGKAEGVVFKNHDTNVYGKFVREDFKEKNHETFGKPKKYQESGAEKLSYQYITEARIRKAAHRLIDEGDWDELRMEMMEDLPREVIRDFADEEGGNVFMGESYEVDLGEFRSTTSSRCASVLQTMVDSKIKEQL